MANDELKKLFVGNIADGTTSEEIEKFLTDQGVEVKKVDTLKNFAFAFVTGDENANTALEVNGKEFNGKALIIQMSRNKMNLPEGENQCFECGKSGHFARDCSQRIGKERGNSSRGRDDRGDRRGDRRDRDRSSSRDRDRRRDRRDDPFGRDLPRDSYRDRPRDSGYPPRDSSRDNSRMSSYSRDPYNSRDRSPPRRQPSPQTRYNSFAEQCAAERERLAYGRPISAQPVYSSYQDPYAGSSASRPMSDSRYMDSRSIGSMSALPRYASSDRPSHFDK